MRTRMDLNALVLFYEAVNSQSISQAATRLGVPKSTVSRKISVLEHQVGSTLVRRGAQGISLTEVGTVLYDHAQKIITEIEDAGFHASEMQSELVGVLRISLPVDFGVSWLSRLIAEFARNHTEIRLVVDINNRWVDVTEEPYDVAVHLGRPRKADLPTRALSSLMRGIYASPDYLARAGYPRTTADIRRHDSISTTHQFEEGVWDFAMAGGTSTAMAEPRILVNNIGIAREVVLAGYGIGILPNVMCQNDVANSRLVRLLEDWNAPSLQVCATYLGRRRVQRKTKVFIDFLADYLISDE